MKTSQPFRHLLGIICSIAFVSFAHAQRDQPNIVLIVVDDMRYDEFGAGGHQYLETPNIDAIAKNGIMFDQAYHAVPLCSPNRASILTGQYPSKHGILDNTARNQASLMLPLFPKYLQEAGYRTAHIGKWHMGNSARPRPGYDYWVSFEGQGRTNDPELFVGNEKKQVNGYITDIFTDHAVDFIRNSSAEDVPFFAYIGHKAVHPEAIQYDDGTVELSKPHEFIPAKRHSGKYADQTITRSPSVPDSVKADEDKPVIKRAFDIRNRILAEDPRWLNTLDPGIAERTIRKRAEMMLAVDEGLGRIVATLEETGELENTVLIFTSDNGYFYGEHGFSVERRMPYQEAIRTPLLMQYPGIEDPGRKAGGFVLSIDLAATIMDVAGIKNVSTIQGKSVLPILKNEAEDIRESAYVEFYSHENPFTWTAKLDYRVVLKDNYKYIKWIRFEDEAELYDLAADPYEMNNLIDEASLKEVVREMEEELRKLQLEALGL